MNKMHRLVPPLLVGVVVVTGLGACSSSKPLAGPLIYGGTAQTICVDHKARQRVVIGSILQAPKDSSVELTGAQLSGSKGVQLDAVYALPVDESGFIGSDDYPPSEKSWQARRALNGTVVKAGTTANVVAVVAAQGADAVAGTLRLTYSVGGQSYSKSGDTTFRLADHCS